MTAQIATEQEDTAIPIACTLTVAEQAAWSEGIGRTVLQGYEEMRELPDGYALRFPGDDSWARTLAEFIVHERGCCPFLAFDLTFAPERGAIWLSMAGSAAIKEFVAALMETTKAPR